MVDRSATSLHGPTDVRPTTGDRRPDGSYIAEPGTRQSRTPLLTNTRRCEPSRVSEWSRRPYKSGRPATLAGAAIRRSLSWASEVVRHVPTNAELFNAYGVAFPKPNAVSSWRPTTPHNVQRKTVQNASCDACHGNAKIFLTSDKVDPNELEANKNALVNKIPPKTGP
jgi:hypothetical protein